MKTMNARDENKVGMFVVAKDTMDDNELLWAGIPAVGTVVNALATRIGNINGFAQTRTVSTKGLTLAKKAARSAMEPVALEVAGIVRAYAASVNDNETLGKVNITATNLKGSRDTVVGNICQVIHDTAKGLLASLVTFGLTQVKLDGLQTKIDAYSGLVGKPRTKRSLTKAAGELLDSEIAATELLLELQLDGLMEQFKATQPLFYASYKAARRIVDNPGGRKAKNGNGATPPPAPH